MKALLLRTVLGYLLPMIFAPGASAKGLELVLETYEQTNVKGTYGYLEVKGQRFYTVELPWRNNRNNESRVPPGLYTLRLRKSPIVSKLTEGRHQKGFEVTGVPGRSLIMIHPGYTMETLEGCIAVGGGLEIINGFCALSDTQAAFDRLMSLLGTSDHSLIIRRN